MAADLLDDVSPTEQWAKTPDAKIEQKPDPLASIQSLDMPTETQMLYFYDNPNERPKGETTHFPELDQIFKWMPGYTNLLTANAGVGKSEFKRQMYLPRAVFDKKKVLTFAPEDMPKEAYYDALIHSLTGQDPDAASFAPLSRARYHKAMQWVREHFYVVQFAKNQGRTPGHLLDIFEAARVKMGVEHFALDPWHKLDHSELNSAGGIQPYLVRELSRLTDWSVETQVYLDIMVNPRSIPRSPNEAWPVPDTDHISGGPTWADMMHTIMSADRPNKHVGRSDPAFALYTRKLKNHRRIGAKPGSIGMNSETPDVLIDFDWKTARYMFAGATPLTHPDVSAIYLSDAEINAHHAPRTGGMPMSTFEQEAKPFVFPSTPEELNKPIPF